MTTAALDPAAGIAEAVRELVDAVRQLVEPDTADPSVLDELSRLVGRARRRINKARKASEESVAESKPRASTPAAAAQTRPAAAQPASINAPARVVTIPIPAARNGTEAQRDPQPVTVLPRPGASPVSYPPSSSAYPTVPAQQHRNGFGVTALVLGIVGAGLGLIPILGFLAIILGVLALVFGLLGYARARKRIASNKAMSITGAILGPVATALGVWGMVIVGQAVNDVNDKIDQINRDLSSITVPPPSPAP